MNYNLVKTIHKFMDVWIEMLHPNLEFTDFYEDVIDVENRCDIPNCNEKKYHMTIAHKCESCFKFGHSLNECPLKIIEIKCPICRKVF